MQEGEKKEGTEEGGEGKWRETLIKDLATNIMLTITTESVLLMRSCCV